MAVYISEVSYKESITEDFAEVAAPAGTDLTGYTIVIYNPQGSVVGTIDLGPVQSTVNGQDYYLVDVSDPDFSGIASSGAVALVDENGNVVQFISFAGNTMTPTEGPAAGLTSTDIGASVKGESLQSDHGGLTYYTQSTPNPGTILCYAPGTMIDAPGGPRAVETLRPGDLVMTLDHGPQPVIWARERFESLDGMSDDSRPVLIQAGALGADRPANDLIVSPQHRILVGGLSQLDDLGEGQAFAPAKSLTGLPCIRFMRGRSEITWIHFACAHHEVVFANGCASETLLFGSMALNELSKPQLRSLRRLFGPQTSSDDALNGPPARPCLTVGAVRKLLFGYRAPRRAAA